MTEELDSIVDHEASQEAVYHEESQAASSVENEDDRTYTAIIYDGPALAHIVGPKSKRTFSEYLNSIWQDLIIRNRIKEASAAKWPTSKELEELPQKFHE